MLFKLRILAAMLAVLAGLPAQAAHTRASLLLATETARPGDTIQAGVKLQMDPGWHIYWKNSGESGTPTEIQWDLPAGVTAGEIRWPVPEKLTEAGLATYIYSNEVVLTIPLTLAANVASGPLTLSAKISWQECSVQCIQASEDVSATLRVGTGSPPSPGPAGAPSWGGNLPRPAGELEAKALWQGPPHGDTRFLTIEWSSTNSNGEADFYPAASDNFEIGGATEKPPSPSGKVVLRKAVKKSSGDWPARIGGVLVQQSGSGRVGFDVDLPVGGGIATSSPAPPGPAGLPAASASEALSASLLSLLFSAFLGGLILNVMPCVLPVIALKILGFVSQSKQDSRKVRTLGLIYTLGVLVSFLALALVIVGLKAAGSSAGWGFQFANPYFLIAMTILVTLITLNLFGVFEITAGSQGLSAASALTSKHGASGAFFNGLLATFLATSCSAPFLGAALGVASAQQSPVIVMVMLSAGLGLAAPYLVLSWQPGWLKFLPKPGPWMDRFKVALGFPMLATAIWLLNLLTTHYGDRTWWMGMFLVVLAIAAWVFGQFVQRASENRGIGLFVVFLFLILGYYVLANQLRWRDLEKESQITNNLQDGKDGVPWQKWSPEAVAAAQAKGLPVVVDFTAKWCLTCQGNKLVLESSAVRTRIKQIGAVPLLADYTRRPEYMTAELNHRGRDAVPMILVFSRDAAKEPVVFDLVTPDALNKALDQAAR